MVSVFICDRCGARIKEGHLGEHCPMCKRKGSAFTKVKEPDPTQDDYHFSKKYDEVVDKLHEYTKGCAKMLPEDGCR